MVKRRTGAEIAVNTFVWHSPLSDSLLAATAPRVASWGFDGIELPIENIGDWDPGRAADLLDSLGLSRSVGAVMPPGRELAAADEATIARTQTYLRHCVDAASRLGASVISGPIYTSVGRCWHMSAGERRSVVAELRTNLLPVVDHAASSGVMLGLEPLNRYETSVVNTAAQAMELLDGLPPEGIGVALDAYHMNIEEKQIGGAIRTGGARLVHLQVSGNDRGAPGPDHIDWDDLGSALGEVGYRALVAIESFTPQNMTIAKAASIWRPLADSQDAIAIDGLALLQPWRAKWLAGNSPTEQSRA
jgi:D-psicose/D-tagatose/L-ribulose 3-epimerase